MVVLAVVEAAVEGVQAQVQVQAQVRAWGVPTLVVSAAVVAAAAR